MKKRKRTQIPKKASKEFAIFDQMAIAASRTASAIATVGAKPDRSTYSAGPRSLVNPHCYTDNSVEATGKIYRKVAERILRRKFYHMKPEKRKKIIWFSTFEKLEELTCDASEKIVLAIDCIFDACVAIHGPSIAFDEEVFIENALHGGPEDGSLAFERLKKLNASSDAVIKNYILVDTLMQMYEYEFLEEHPDDYYVSWDGVSGKELTRNLVYVDPVAYDLGIGVNTENVTNFYEELRQISTAKIS